MKLAKMLVLAAAAGISGSLALSAHAADDDSFAPGGTAIDHSTVKRHDQKIVMDLKALNPETVKYGLMVATRIHSLRGEKLVVVIQGPLVSIFAKKNYLEHQGIIDKFAALAKAGVHFEYCGNSVEAAKLTPADMMGLDEKNPAVVNSGAYPSLAHYESKGYALIVPFQFPAHAPAAPPAPAAAR
jgi:intracellular sulfur oxidation DsrE/DsrF family protein